MGGAVRVRLGGAGRQRAFGGRGEECLTLSSGVTAVQKAEPFPTPLHHVWQGVTAGFATSPTTRACAAPVLTNATSETPPSIYAPSPRPASFLPFTPAAWIAVSPTTGAESVRLLPHTQSKRRVVSHGHASGPAASARRFAWQRSSMTLGSTATASRQRSWHEMSASSSSASTDPSSSTHAGSTQRSIAQST